MKLSKINLVMAWQWLERELDERDLTATQQLTLFHLLIKLNRNFWKPARVSMNKLAVACNKDKRTVKKAIAELIELGLVVEIEGGYYLGIDGSNVRTYPQISTNADRQVSYGNIDDSDVGSDELDDERIAKYYR